MWNIFKFFIEILFASLLKAQAGRGRISMVEPLHSLLEALAPQGKQTKYTLR